MESNILKQFKLVHRIYEKYFRNEFLESRGEEFSHFFARVMWRIEGSDYLATKEGGYLQSERTLFYCCDTNYIHDVPAWEQNIIMKFQEIRHVLSPHIDKWIFVNNWTVKGPRFVPEGAVYYLVWDLCEKLKRANLDIIIKAWGYYELLDLFKQLSLEDLVGWFGSDGIELTNIRDSIDELTFEDVGAIITK